MGSDAEDAKMPLLDHLVELRRRLMYSVGGFLVCFFISYYFAADIFNFLLQPLADIWEGDESRRLIFTQIYRKYHGTKKGFLRFVQTSFPGASDGWTSGGEKTLLEL